MLILAFEANSALSWQNGLFSAFELIVDSYDFLHGSSPNPLLVGTVIIWNDAKWRFFMADARFGSGELRCQRWDVLHIMTSLVYPKQMIGIWSPGRQILPFVGWCWMLLQSSRKIIIEHRWKCLNCIQKHHCAADCLKSAKSSCLVIQRMQIFNGLIVLSCSFILNMSWLFFLKL